MVKQFDSHILPHKLNLYVPNLPKHLAENHHEKVGVFEYILDDEDYL